MKGSTLSRQIFIIGLLLFMAWPFTECNNQQKSRPAAQVQEPAQWKIPDTSLLASSAAAGLIRYGKELIINTARYLGPKGIVAPISNGMNCGNCHLDGGTRLNGNCFALVATTYPKYRNRSGKTESIQFRVNDCMERSLNGKKLDSSSKEMEAIVAYINWLGKDTPKNSHLKGMGIPEMPLLSRAAATDNGRKVFNLRCASCHGINGMGLLQLDSAGYIYPPLWGKHSYNVSAGIFMVSKLAGFVKYNMPYNAVQQPPLLSDEEAWDVAAYVNSQERTLKIFPEDWPVLATKPADYPFGPYADSFSERQHKYGPFANIKKAGKK